MREEQALVYAVTALRAARALIRTGAPYASSADVRQLCEQIRDAVPVD